MTQEEKAKRYDEAIEKGKQIQNTPYTAHWDIMKEVAEHLLPELKESEDERIRKELIEFVKSRGGFKQEYIAWLEKQGKNNIGISESTKQELEDKLNNALEKETPESCNEFLEKQCEQKSYASETMNEKGDFDSGFTRMMEKEQKPAFEMITPEESLAKSEDEMIRKDLLYWLYSYKDGNETFVPAGDVDVWISYLEKQGEQQDHSKFLDSIQIGDQVTKNEDGVLVNLSQLKRVAKTEDKVEKKPAWSEEDESCLNTTIAYLKDAKEFKKTAENCINWLKSLKDRVQPQPKQEWTMQDEEELQIALDTLVKAGQHSSAKWLKNVCLVPQSHWKPSEEQMLAINTAINVLGKGTLNGKQLVELQEQLKKL